MDERYYMEISVLEKIEEILEMFKDHKVHVLSPKDTGYEWLEEDDSKCIVFENPYYDQTLDIATRGVGEFTLFFAESHAHYANNQLDYDRLIERIGGILQNQICAGGLNDGNGKWFGSAFFDKEDVKKAPKDAFDFVFKEKEFAKKLLRNGYQAKYSFWNPIDNIVIKG